TILLLKSNMLGNKFKPDVFSRRLLNVSGHVKSQCLPFLTTQRTVIWLPDSFGQRLISQITQHRGQGSGRHAGLIFRQIFSCLLSRQSFKHVTLKRLTVNHKWQHVMRRARKGQLTPSRNSKSNRVYLSALYLPIKQHNTKDRKTYLQSFLYIVTKFYCFSKMANERADGLIRDDRRVTTKQLAAQLEYSNVCAKRALKCLTVDHKEQRRVI
ncbi:hypothetical protein L9F63_011268, partial [Diploptera punctata]